MDRIFLKNALENKEMVFKKWVKNIQTEAYNGALTVYELKLMSNLAKFHYWPNNIHKPYILLVWNVWKISHVYTTKQRHTFIKIKIPALNCTT